MRANCLGSRLVAAGVVVFLVCTLSLGFAGPQDEKKSPKDASPLQPGKKSEPQREDALPRLVVENDKVGAVIDKMIAAYDLKPGPVPEIPDDPPPHEGAMIGLPNVVEPPDLVIVEVLDALPGRPISGERLVRPDGKISLGFYGDVDARGLTEEQLKVAIIKHLRRYLADESLGLQSLLDEQGLQGAARRKSRLPLPSIPDGDNPLGPPATGKTKPTTYPGQPRSSLNHRRFTTRRATASTVPVRVVRSPGRSAELQVAKKPEDKEMPVKIEAGGKAKITITVEVDDRGRPAEGKVQPAPEAPVEQDGPWAVIPPAESTTVFVDITAYNSKHFYVEGDVQIIGKFPWTGNETVLDALQHAGGLMPQAEPKDIRLVRPGRNGKPSRVYKVDLEAIQEKGDVATNYQMFPGDRLVIGRNALVKRTTELDRLAAPLQTVTGWNLQYAFMLRSLQLAGGDSRDEMLKELVDFWAKELSREGDVKLDEQTLRNALSRKLRFSPPPVAPDGK